MSILLSFIPTLIMIALVVAIVRKVSSRSKPLDSNTQPVRLFFQYSLVFGLFMIVKQLGFCSCWWTATCRDLDLAEKFIERKPF